MTDTDVRALLSVLDRCRPDADRDIFYEHVLTGLRELIPCDDISFQLMDVAEQRLRVLFVTDDGVNPVEDRRGQRTKVFFRDRPWRGSCGFSGATNEFTRLFWQEFWEEDGCACSVATGDYSTLLHHAELTRTRAYANSPLGSAFGARGVKDEILVPMTPLGGTDRRLLLFRDEGSPDF